MRFIFACLFLINIWYIGLSFEPTAVCKTPNVPSSNDIYYVAIIDEAVGSLISHAHNYLLQHVYCGLNDAKNGKSRVQFHSWHIDTHLGECTIFESNDGIENIHGKMYGNGIIPPPQQGIKLCKKLELAKRCASTIPRDQKVEIAIPMALHDEFGKCDINKFFDFKDQKVVIFWTHDYRQSPYPVLLPGYVDLVIFGSGLDFLPRENWEPNDEMTGALKNGKSEMAKSLNLRFQQMIGIKKKKIEEEEVHKRKRVRTKTSSSSSPKVVSTKMPSAEIVHAGIGFPFFQPKSPVKRNLTKSVVAADTLPLAVHGKSGNAYFAQSEAKHAVNDNNTSAVTGPVVIITKSPPPSTTTPTGFFAAFGIFFGAPEYGLECFILFLCGAFLLFMLFLCCMWCCCYRESSKGKYEVLQKENQPLTAEPDPEAGIAYSTPSGEPYEQPLVAKSIVSRESVKIQKPQNSNRQISSRHSNTRNRHVSSRHSKTQNSKRHVSSSEESMESNHHVSLKEGKGASDNRPIPKLKSRKQRKSKHASRGSTKAQKARKAKQHVSFKEGNENNPVGKVQLLSDDDNPFGSPQTPPMSPPIEPKRFSPAPLTPLPSQVSQAATTRSVKFDIGREDDRPIPELKPLSDDDPWE